MDKELLKFRSSAITFSWYNFCFLNSIWDKQSINSTLRKQIECHRVAFSLWPARLESSGATCWQKARDGGGVRPGMRAARDQLCLRPLTFVCTRCSLSLFLAPAGELCQQTCEMRWKIELDTARGHFAGKHPRHSRWRAFSTAAAPLREKRKIFIFLLCTHTQTVPSWDVLGDTHLIKIWCGQKRLFSSEGNNIQKGAINYLVLL